MFSLLKKIVGRGPDFETAIAAINALGSEVQNLSGEVLEAKAAELQARLKAGETLDDILPEAFALVREAATRTLDQKHYDVQLMGGIALHRGMIAEMMTGEGKTLAATTAVYLNALGGRGVHVVTVNEYLAKRDTVWMGQIYHALGLSVACLVHEGALLYDPDYILSKSEFINSKSETLKQSATADGTWRVNASPKANQLASLSLRRSRPSAEKSQIQNSKHEHKESALLDKERDMTGSFRVQEEYLRPVKRREAYEADITYGTNHEFGFDYLRDNLVYRLEDMVQRSPRGEIGGLNFAVIDEVDSVLIDEARTPLIISAPDAESSEYYKVFARVSAKLIEGEDYEIDEKLRTVSIVDAGINKVEKLLGLKDFYAPENMRLVHYLEESLKAKALFKRDKDYVVKNNEIIIVDQFTGRLMLGRRYSGGLHQAIEAKEGVLVKEESRTYAKISIQNYFRLYKKIAGMTGTAQTSAEEFHKVYNLDVVSIPTNKPMIRKDHPDVIYKTRRAKFEAVVAKVKESIAKSQPVLIGTASIENNEVVSAFLSRAGVRHEVLNAKNHEREGAIIAQAGRPGAVTVATNMAGRGVDIVLGGNPPDSRAAQKVRDAGGVMVIGTERHEARRIDNQLRGRSGRQGDSGESQFFLSLEDDLLRIFGGERLQNMMETLRAPEDMPLESNILSRVVSQAQAKVEGFNFDARKHMLEYDDVLNKQRTDFYLKRRRLLESTEKVELKKFIGEFVYSAADALIDSELLGSGVLASDVSGTRTDSKLSTLFHEAGIIKDKNQLDALSKNNDSQQIKGSIHKEIESRLDGILEVDVGIIPRLLSVLDMLWMTHLENMEALQESVRLRAYAQHDPLVEFRRESFNLYKDFFAQFGSWMLFNLFKAQTFLSGSMVAATPIKVQEKPKEHKGIGRNDPCFCGSGKKYKRCHGS